MQRPRSLLRSPHLHASLPLLVVLACSSVPPDAVGTAASRVEGGEVDSESKHVFRVLARVTGFNELCSATLIAPQLMLTARHCVAPTPNTNVNCATDRFGPTVAPSELKFSNDVEPDLTSRWFDASAVLVSPESDFTCGYDIAVVILKEPVPKSIATPAEPRFSPLIQNGEPYSAVGYGGSDANEDAAEYGIRHSRTGLSVACGQSNCADSTIMDQEFLGSEGACKGDSGGPAIDKDGQVIGVLSRGADGCESPIYVGVPAFETLLVTAAEQASRTLGATLPVWAGGEAIPITSAPEVNTEAPTDSSDEGPSTEDDEGEDGGDDAAQPSLAREGCTLRPGNQASPAATLLLVAVALWGWRRKAPSRR